MIDSQLATEFETIEKTRFWKEYCEKLDEARGRLVKLLCTNRIGGPVVMGDVWQESLKLLDRIIGTPKKLIGTDTPE
jgi:hypothetical protein